LHLISPFNFPALNKEKRRVIEVVDGGKRVLVILSDIL
jgi:hypothetical protein